jgi:NitT/TauT family transport system substrate-binding protein
VAALAVLTLTVTTAGCSLGGNGAAGSDVTHPGLQVPIDLENGCGEQASTDVYDVAANRSVARCAPGYPEAEPLPAPVTLRVGIRAPSEDLAPVLVGDELGVFADENLTVELVEIDDPVELFTALDQGRVDVVAGDLDAAFFDLVNAGSGARQALGGAVPAAAGDVGADQAGLWLRSDATSQPWSWFDLRGQRIAVQDGIGDAAMYPMAALLRQDDLSINDTHLVPASGEEAVDALVAGSVAGAWLPEPYWHSVADRGGIRLVTTPPSEALGGVVLAERLLDESRDRHVGLAFVRAVIRTVNTYLSVGYQSDGEVVAALTATTGRSEEQITETPEWIFDWELRSETTQRLQKPWLKLGAVVYEEELPELQLVDRSLYREVLR